MIPSRSNGAAGGSSARFPGEQSGMKPSISPGRSVITPSYHSSPSTQPGTTPGFKPAGSMPGFSSPSTGPRGVIPTGRGYQPAKVAASSATMRIAGTAPDGESRLPVSRPSSESSRTVPSTAVSHDGPSRQPQTQEARTYDARLTSSAQNRTASPVFGGVRELPARLSPPAHGPSPQKSPRSPASTASGSPTPVSAAAQSPARMRTSPNPGTLSAGPQPGTQQPNTARLDHITPQYSQSAPHSARPAIGAIRPTSTVEQRRLSGGTLNVRGPSVPGGSMPASPAGPGRNAPLDPRRAPPPNQHPNSAIRMMEMPARSASPRISTVHTNEPGSPQSVPRAITPTSSSPAPKGFPGSVSKPAAKPGSIEVAARPRPYAVQGAPLQAKPKPRPSSLGPTPGHASLTMPPSVLAPSNPNASTSIAADIPQPATYATPSTAPAPLPSALAGGNRPKGDKPKKVLRVSSTPQEKHYEAEPCEQEDHDDVDKDLLRKPSAFNFSDRGTVYVACPRCGANYHGGGTPCILQCNHTFCADCMEVLKIGNKISCPRCHKVTDLGDQGVAGLPRNYALTSLAEIDTDELQRRPTCLLVDLLDASCPICFEAYGDKTVPLNLGCGHTACDLCLMMIAEKEASDKIECPTCREIVDLNETTANLDLKKTVETVKQLKAHARYMAEKKAKVS